MKVLLVHPPVCDPTMPYVATPLLAAVLEREGIEVGLVDANVEALDWLLAAPRLRDLEARVRRRFDRLDRSAGLDHGRQLAWLALHDGLRAAAALRHSGKTVGRARNDRGSIEEAKDLLRGRRGDLFFDPAHYGWAADTVEAALRLVSAAYSPVSMDLRSYRTPFAFLNEQEIRSDASPEHDPMHGYFAGPLSDRIDRERIDLVGISAVFPGQLQPAWSLAWTLRQRFPGLRLVVGGPALTQRMVHLPDATATRLLVPFDAAVLFEGEEALCDIVREAAAGRMPFGLIRGTPSRDLASLPFPLFERLPLERYLAPEPVLPYDASRGCYWGRCSFCHYGPVAEGTAKYRERPLETIVAHAARMRALGARIIYLSHDTLSPALGSRLARALAEGEVGVRWGSDLRPEPAITPDWCRQVAQGGALAFSLGIESGSPRVLERMDKGTTAEAASRAVRNLAGAGIAAEAMVFLDFPTETAAEAGETLSFLEEHHPFLSLFMCGTFGLTHGSGVARHPERFGLESVFSVAGDEFRTALFYEEAGAGKSERERESLDSKLAAVARRWYLRPYPWAGSLSTAHTLLWVDRYGPGVFRERGPSPPAPLPRTKLRARYSDAPLREQAMAVEAEIWHRLVYEERRVGRDAWKRAAAELSGRPLRPSRR
ncbi:MAG: radical SAM protein [Deltaproteobacteria bacterium]|nr:radical SAM protein [Deltaproteobacteria bacterium]